MHNDVKTIIIFSIIFTVFLINNINNISAEMLVSEVGVQYDSKILEKFESNTFANVIIILEESVDIDNFVTEFSNDEFKDVINRNIPNKSSNRFGAKISEDAFFKLLQDERVENIEYNWVGYAGPISKECGNWSSLSKSLIFMASLILITLILYSLI